MEHPTSSRFTSSLTAMNCLLVAGLSTLIGWFPEVRADSPASIDDRFRSVVTPFLEDYCLSCHDKAGKKGNLDLTVFPNPESVAADLAHWELVLDNLEQKTMPPEKSKAQPGEDERRQVVEWIRAIRKREATRHAGDPGLVSARRLSNAEYDHTIRDLTGVDLRPTKEFPVDPANRAGFDNSAESLTMSPALVKKYLEAARSISEHLVFNPDGLAFAEHPMIADTDRDKYCTRQIIEFYKKQRLDYADFFEAAWRYRYREQLGRPTIRLAEIAKDSHLSPGYLTLIWTTLTTQGESVGPIAAIQSLWNDLPKPGPEPEMMKTVRAGCEGMRDFVIELRKWLVPKIPNLTLKGADTGAQPLVLWKDRQFVANRRRYSGGLEALMASPLKSGTSTARDLATPPQISDISRYEPDYRRFCSIFPDAFLVSERARMFLTNENDDKLNVGRFLSAGFHNQMGYFRDDQPLYDLILDDVGRRQLDKLWLAFNCVTGAPIRQHSGFIWNEKSEPPAFMGSPEFDFSRAEDKNASSEPMMMRLAAAYLEKARKVKANATILKAIEDHFRISNANIRLVEKTRLAAEPGHVAALQDFAERAFRRPLTRAERDEIPAFYRSLRDREALSHEDAIRDTLVIILLSPNFCYRVDLPGDGGGTSIQRLSDYDLASRLSYFLWSSMPDQELLSHAAAGDLHKPEVLVGQARRMLRDERVRGMATEFAGNWLDFRRFEELNSVDRARFPSFNDQLRQAMFEEPLRFFIDVARNDRPVFEFLEGNHTFVNAALAKHYEIPVSKFGPDGWARVDDARNYGRGGLLPMAVFLTKNSPGLRTSPVKRGYWVVRRLLGENIPAPPPNVPQLPADEAKLGDLTLRETLARHRADKSCASCHERFDSLGVAYEGYGPIGERRKLDFGGKPVDTRASFPGGDEGSGFEGLRAYVDAHRKDDFIDNLNRKLLAYALGRTLIPSDDEILVTMKARLKADGGRFGSLIETIITSPQFLNRRVEAQKKREG